MDDCWHADAEQRPTFEQIIKLLEEMLVKLPPHQHFTQDAGCSSCTVQ